MGNIYTAPGDLTGTHNTKSTLELYGSTITIEDLDRLPFAYRSLEGLTTGMLDDYYRVGDAFDHAARGKTALVRRMEKLFNELDFILLGGEAAQVEVRDNPRKYASNLRRMILPVVMRMAKVRGCEHYKGGIPKPPADAFVEIHDFLTEYGSGLTLHDVTLLPKDATLTSLARAAFREMHLTFFHGAENRMLKACVLSDVSTEMEMRMQVCTELIDIFAGHSAQLPTHPKAKAKWHSMPLETLLKLTNGDFVKRS